MFSHFIGNIQKESSAMSKVNKINYGIAFLVGCLVVSSPLHAYNLEPYKWDSSVVPIYFRFDPGAYNGAFNDAIKKWNAVNHAVVLRSGAESLIDGTGTACSDETNSASFGYSVCSKKWQEGVLAVTLISYNANGNAIHGAIIFNSTEKIDLYAGPLRTDSIDFGRVALHELGHFLGLNHEGRVAAIMQPIINNNEILRADDISGIHARYQQIEIRLKH